MSLSTVSTANPNPPEDGDEVSVDDMDEFRALMRFIENDNAREKQKARAAKAFELNRRGGGSWDEFHDLFDKVHDGELEREFDGEAPDEELMAVLRKVAAAAAAAAALRARERARVRGGKKSRKQRKRRRTRRRR